MSVQQKPFDLQEAALVARREYIDNLKEIYEKRRQGIRGRKVEYLQNSRYAQSTCALLTGSSMLGGTVAGGITGAICGGALSGPGAPVGMLGGSLIGAGVGFVVGAGVGVSLSAYNLQWDYQKWCRTQAGIEFAEDLAALLTHNELFKNVLCNIFFIPVVDGVYTPSGHLYERSAILESIRIYGEDPETRIPLTADQLVDADIETAESVKNFVTFLRQNREETLQNAPHLIEGYDKLINDYRVAFATVHGQKQEILTRRFKAGLIDYEEFARQSAELIIKYLSLV